MQVGSKDVGDGKYGSFLGKPGLERREEAGEVVMGVEGMVFALILFQAAGPQFLRCHVRLA